MLLETQSSWSFSCRKLRATRQRLIELFGNPENSVDDITVVFTEYVGLIRGLVDAPTGGDSKLRTLTPFKWTNSLGGRVPRYAQYGVILLS